MAPENADLVTFNAFEYTWVRIFAFYNQLYLFTMPHFVAFLTCLLLCFSAQSQNNWVQLNSGTDADLNGLHMLNAVEGFVVGDSGTALKTVDAAQTWTQMSVPSNANFTSIAFLDQDTGYITPDFGSILYTHDGGTTWFEDSTTFFGLCYWDKIRIDANGLNWLIYNGCFSNNEIISWNPHTGDTTTLQVYNWVNYLSAPNDIDFPSPGAAVVVGDSGMVFRTADSGDNWSLIAFPDANQNLLSVDFVNADTGYAFSQDLFYPKFITADGGLTWAVDSSWQANQTFFYPQFTDIEYLPSGNGILAGISNGSEGVAFYNGYNNNTLSNISIFRGVDMITDSMAYIVGDSGYIARFGNVLLAVEEADVPQSIGVYPNPTNGGTYFIAPVDLPSGARVELFDLQGRMVYQKVLPQLYAEEAHRMELGQIQNGSYILSVVAEGKHWQERLMKMD